MTSLRQDPNRLETLMTLMSGDEKHDASALSTLDAIAVLYDQILNVDPARADDPDRNRFLLSKGHGPMAYYAVLAAHGFLTEDQLRGWATADSVLGGHPDATLVPGAEIGSGSLGHGLGLGVGTALGLRLAGRSTPRVVVLTGDAELDEGSNWEAVAYAGRVGLDRLLVVVIDNASASWGWPGGIANRFVTEGWSGVTVDGHDRAALAQAYRAGPGDRPHVVIAQVQGR